jgi:hypothetical protein
MQYRMPGEVESVSSGRGLGDWKKREHGRHFLPGPHNTLKCIYKKCCKGDIGVKI